MKQAKVKIQAQNKKDNRMAGKQKKKKSLKVLLFALILTVLVISTVMIVRIVQDKALFPIGESYHNLHISLSLQKDFFLSADPVQGTPYEPNPYHYLLALVFFILPVNLSLFMPLVLGVLSAFLFYKILLLIKVKREIAPYVLIILVVTPAFIILFTGLLLAGFIIFLSLLTILFALNKKYIHQVICVLLFILLALTSLTGFLLTLIILLLLCLLLKRKIKIFFIPLIISVITLLAFTLLTNYTPRIIGFHTFAFQKILSVLQASLGFDVFLLLIFIAGFILVWIKDRERRLFHLAVLGLLALSFFNIIARVFVSFIITIYCARVIIYLHKRKWDSEVVKIGTLILLLCSLVFSLVNQTTLLVDAQPDKEMTSALLFFKGLAKGNVLASEEYGFVIEFETKNKVLLDSYSYLYPDYNEKKQDAQALFGFVRLFEAEPIFEKYNIRYVFITPSMKENLWANEEKGLWFLAIHSGSFISKYENTGIEIWEYAPIQEPEG